jgi:UTP-glucose-1-phosphate uridylyltransferase
MAAWAQHIPKEFQPVAGRPGILHLLDEFTALAPARIILVYHPFYERFIAWAKMTLGRGGLAAYQRAAGLPATDLPLHEQLDLTFVAQRGRYADITSVLNAVEHLEPGDVFIAFADNLYPYDNPALALARAPAGRTAVLVRPYRREEAATRGVIVSRYHDGEQVVSNLVEKPSASVAARLETKHGHDCLWLFEGRARLSWSLIRKLGDWQMRPGTEPKLSLAIRDHARDESIVVVPTHSGVFDLGNIASNRGTAGVTAL